MSKRRVVVTGLGMITPVGNTVDDTWKNILNGKSGIAPIQHFDTSDFSVRIGGSIKNLELDEYISKKEKILLKKRMEKHKAKMMIIKKKKMLLTLISKK